MHTHTQSLIIYFKNGSGFPGIHLQLSLMTVRLQSHQETESPLCLHRRVWSQTQRKEQSWEWLGELEPLSGLLQSGPTGAGGMTERPSNTLSVIFVIHSRRRTNRNARGGHSVWRKPVFIGCTQKKATIKTPQKKAPGTVLKHTRMESSWLLPQKRRALPLYRWLQTPSCQLVQVHISF